MRRYLPNALLTLGAEVLVDDLAGRSLWEVFQPEVLYEQLLTLTVPTCLNAWLVLRRNPLPPNVNHLFLVAYACASHTPLVTTNFDLLFEDAADQLGLRPVVYVPGDSPARLKQPLSPNEFWLWKVHGSIAGDPADWSRGRDDPRPPLSLLTTMESISRVNVGVLSALESAIKGRTLCFVGYSGRDVDLFPEIKARRPRLLWIDGNFARGSTSDLASVLNRKLDQLKGESLDVWPDQVFSEYDRMHKLLPGGHKVNLSSVRQRCQHYRASFDHSRAFDEVLPKHLGADWDSYRERLLEVLLLKARGRYAVALDKGRVLEADLVRGGAAPELCELAALTAAQLSHERSRYVDCEAYALKGRRRVAELPRPDRKVFRVLFDCWAAEGRRMQFAHDLHSQVEVTLSPRFAIQALWSLLWQAAKMVPWILWAKRDSGAPVSRSRILHLYAQFEAVENAIRLIAFLRAFAQRGASGRTWIWSFVRPPMTAALKALDSKSKKFGYAAGSANARKFLARIPSASSVDVRATIEEGIELYQVGHYETGLELSDRNLGDLFFDGRRYPEAEAAYGSMLKRARSSGNGLNAVKAWVGIALCRERTSRPALSVAEADELRQLCGEVQGDDWQRVLRGVVERFQPHP
jgi:hypothetical protein